MSVPDILLGMGSPRRIHYKITGAGRGFSGVAVWMVAETLAGVGKERVTHMTDLGRAVKKAALVALVLLMAPLAGSLLVEGWNWNVGGFVFAYLLFFGTALAYGLIAKKMGSWAYKAGVGLALVTGFVLGWTNMVHLSESENPVNFLYFGVLVVGAVGAWVARLEARGLSRALFLMAAVLAVLVVALASYAPAELERGVATGHSVFVAMFAASGLLFRYAGSARTK